MVKKSKILILPLFLMLISFFYLLPSGSANEDEQLNDSEYNEISDSSIKELTNDSLFIAYRGTLPETIDQKWENSIVNCWLNLTLMRPSYSKFDRSIKSVATNNKVIIIDLDSAYKEEIDDSRIDEIYQKIDNYCRQQEGISEIPVVFMWAQENPPLPDYGPKAFEEAKKHFTGFITTRGTMPEIHQEEEKWKWINSLVGGSQSLSPPSTTELSPYFAVSGGPVNGFGADINGYLLVSFDPATPEKVNESVIDEIYQVIDKHFEQEGISDVPVVFAFVKITDDLAPADGPDANESNDTNLSDNKEKIVGNETTNQMPGFTSIMVVLGLLSLLIIKR